ncbi:C2 domain [Dillenia turbinata]|uniref:C2 domain n=1 Tax=Dillenia turbinata TaxID=194707 RepID=A0AAN8UQP9_9MAGN
MSMLMIPFQLLEINVISVQDLAPMVRNMRAYAIAWVHPDRKLLTRVDTYGHTNPTWNDKFVFRVGDEFLKADTSAVVIEIYALHWFRDIHVGTVRILVSNVIPPMDGGSRCYPGMRFVALQVRRRSGRPQGILNIGVALLNNFIRSMPLYTNLSSSAVGYRDLMGEVDQQNHHQHHFLHHHNDKNQKDHTSMKTLWRVKSDLSEHPSTLANRLSPKPARSVLSASDTGTTRAAKVENADSIVNGSDFETNGTTKQGKSNKGKCGSMLGSELDMTESVILKIKYTEYGDQIRELAKKKKLGSILNDESPTRDKSTKEKKNVGFERPEKVILYDIPKKKVVATPHIAGSVLLGSDLGPSPSEVAMAVAEGRYPIRDTGDSVLGWSLDGSIEGLHSKLQRWRSELPPIYDRSEKNSSFHSNLHHRRRHSDGGGLFSCFGNICGMECSIVCGRNAPKKKGSGKALGSPSMGTTITESYL